MSRHLLKVAMAVMVVAGCASKKEEPPKRPRTWCEQLLASPQEHPSAIRLPPAEYDHCRNQVYADLLKSLSRDGGIQ